MEKSLLFGLRNFCFLFVTFLLPTVREVLIINGTSLKNFRFENFLGNSSF